MDKKEIQVRPVVLRSADDNDTKANPEKSGSAVLGSMDSAALDDSIYRFNSSQGPAVYDAKGPDVGHEGRRPVVCHTADESSQFPVGNVASPHETE